ncbi:MAG TPA: UvrD-helicase domain-containing protein [Bryobacteraceae bacterium]|nr:UvrD-helicase domain-containing protein [Bryobacteraceae bacterium]
MPLSKRQLAAAHRTGQDVCTIAGPGSGKTSVLIERFAWLIREQGVRPGRILAITFTDKAAAEIRERAVREFATQPEVREEIERAWISTIHSFCARLLRENAIDAEIDPAFRVLERGGPVLREVADEVLEEMFRTDPASSGKFLRSLAVATSRTQWVPDIADALVQVHNALRLNAVEPSSIVPPLAPVDADWERLRAMAVEILAESPRTKTPRQSEHHGLIKDWAAEVCALPRQLTPAHFAVLSGPKVDGRSLVKGSAACSRHPEIKALLDPLTQRSLPHFYMGERELVSSVLARIAERFRDRKRQMSCLDFDDLEEFAIRLLEKDDKLRQRVGAGFDYVLMDELQDTNPLQWKLVNLIRRTDRFFAVGDINQSIYGFRHAQPELLANYRAGLEQQGLAVDELRDNYRSRAEVLDAANRIFAQAPGVEAHTLVAGRSFSPQTGASVDVQVTVGESNPEAERVEARWVAQRILDLHGTLRIEGEPVKYGDFAILTRMNGSTGALQTALDEFGVPSVVLGGQTLYDTREIRDVMLALRVLANPCDEIALAGLLRSPLFGISDEELLRMTAAHGSLSRAVTAAPPRNWTTIAEARELRNVLSPDRLVRNLTDEADYESGLSDRGRANLEKFLASLRQSWSDDPRPLADFVSELEDAAPEAEAPPPEYANSVRLMTLHKSKGLEFPVVVLPFLHRGRNTGFPVISYREGRGLGLNWRNPATGEGTGDDTWDANRAAARAAEEQEENRILYVGMTRARHHLVLSWSQTPRSRGSWPKLVASGLGISTTEVAAQPVIQAGVRVAVHDQEPPRPPAAQARSASVAQILELQPLPSDWSLSAEGTASVTDISSFHACPRRYYLRRYLGIAPSQQPQPDQSTPRQGIAAAELGDQVHRLLAGQPLEDPHPQAAALADRFRTSPLGKKAVNAASAEREWDFVAEVAGTVLRGQVDLWFMSGRDLVVVDYKTDRNPGEEAVYEYSLQVQIYALVLATYTGRQVNRAVLHFLSPDRVVDVDLTPLALGGAREAIHRFREAQERGQFPLREGAHCRTCEFWRGVCPAGRTTAASAASAASVLSPPAAS